MTENPEADTKMKKKHQDSEENRSEKTVTDHQKEELLLTKKGLRKKVSVQNSSKTRKEEKPMFLKIPE